MNLRKWVKQNKLEFGILIAILVFAFILRLSSLGNAPLWVDESISANTAKAITEKGIPEFSSGYIDERAYAFHYIQAFFLLFGINDFTVRLISALFGLLTIILAYLIGKEYSKSGGLIAAAFTALFYLEVFYSRQARMYQMFQFFFFLTLYLLYKSKEKPILLIPTIVSFFIAYDTHLAGLILAPFIILHILIYNKKYWYSCILPAIPLIIKLIPASNLSTGVSESTINYASTYFSFTYSIIYLLILASIGLIWAFAKKKRLTLFILLPSLALLVGIFTLEVFAFRYSYFFVFPIVFYSSILLAFLYDKYGKMILIPIIILILVPSNLFYPHTYVNVIKPIDYNYNDFSAPEVNYKALPSNLTEELRHSTLMTFFSPEVEWYIKKPDYVFPFSLDGRGDDQVSRNTTRGVVDFYSGANISMNKPDGKFYFLADYFGNSKLKSAQRDKFSLIVQNCSIAFEGNDLRVYSC